MAREPKKSLTPTPEDKASADQIYMRDDEGNFFPVAIEAEGEHSERYSGMLLAQEKYHSGPLPAVETFREYGEVVADAPERILRMAEKEQDASHEFARGLRQDEKTLVSQGQWMGFIAMLVALCGGIYLAINDHEWVAAALVSPAVITPIMRFYFKGRHDAADGRSKTEIAELE